MRATARAISITPHRAMDQGCGLRAADVDVAGSSEKLEANVLLLEADGEEPLILVSIDALYPGIQLSEAIRGAVPDLPHERVLIGATHTHAAPMTDATKSGLGRPDSRHLTALSRLLGQAVRQMRAEVTGSSLVAVLGASGMADHSVNRRRQQSFVLARRFRLSHIAMAPNLSGSRDETITLFTIVDEAGIPVAVVWNYACHPVAQPSPEKYSPHFPGQVRERIRDHFDDPGLPVLYFQGFSGDTRPSDSFRKSTTIERIRAAGRPYTFDRMSSLTYARWSASLADRVVEVLDTAQLIEIDGVSTSSELVSGERFTAHQALPVSFQAIRLGARLTLVGIGAEPVSAWAPWVRSLAGSDLVMCIGCIDQTYGYLPTDGVRREGGYEGGDFCAQFGLGEISPSVDASARSAIQRVVDGLYTRHDGGARSGQD